jgi:hypothetical protein
LKPGRINGLVNNVGLIPSLFDMQGIGFNKNIDGKSFMPLIANRDSKWRYDSLNEGCLNRKQADLDAFMVDRHFKLITNKTDGVQSLFNLTEDPHEQYPITPKQEGASSLKEMLHFLAKKRKEFLSAAYKKKNLVKNLHKEDLEDIKTLGYL